MNKSVNMIKDGVKISFSGEVKKQNIVTMVENCSTGKCECMSNETKQKITNMKVSGEDGNVKLELNGEISVAEIEKALSNSKVI